MCGPTLCRHHGGTRDDDDDCDDAAADRERLIAELDGMAQQRERQLRLEIMAEQNAENLQK